MNRAVDALGAEQVLSVRNVPVRAVCGSYGWELHALERGYFPVSSTGYRSLSGQTLSPELLSELAERSDAERAAALRSARAVIANPLRGPHLCLADPITRYIRLWTAAHDAAAAGLFAPFHERAGLWAAAVQAYTLIVSSSALQPAPDSFHLRWPAEDCERCLLLCAQARSALLEALAGNIEALSGSLIIGVGTYLALPALADGEPVAPAPSCNFELDLGASSCASAAASSSEPTIPKDPSPASAAAVPAVDPQLPLF